jgi:hypothetical protein
MYFCTTPRSLPQSLNCERPIRLGGPGIKASDGTTRTYPFWLRAATSHGASRRIVSKSSSAAPSSPRIFRHAALVRRYVRFAGSDATARFKSSIASSKDPSRCSNEPLRKLRFLKPCLKARSSLALFTSLHARPLGAGAHAPAQIGQEVQPGQWEGQDLPPKCP